MRLLFELDGGNYENCTHQRIRNSVRSIIIKDGWIAMVHALKYGYYKFPGGGIREGEEPVDALIREAREEAGLVIRPESIREYGYVHRQERAVSDETECFIQDNYYYFCQAEDQLVSQQLDDYEAEEDFRLEYVDALTAILANRSVGFSPYSPLMFEREARVLEMLAEEGYLDQES